MATEGSQEHRLGSIYTHHRQIGDFMPCPTIGGNVTRTDHVSSCRAAY